MSPEIPAERATEANPDERKVTPPPVSLSPPPHHLYDPEAGQQQSPHSAHTEENIYDATPRMSVVSPQDGYGTMDTVETGLARIIESAKVAPLSVYRIAPTVEPKAAGPSHDPATDQKAHDSSSRRAGDYSVEPTSPVAPPKVASPAPVNGLAVQPPPPAHHASDSNAGENKANGAAASKPSSADIFEQAKRQMLLREQEEKIPVFPSEPDFTVAPAERKEAEELPQMSATSYPGQEWNPYGDGFDTWEE